MNKTKSYYIKVFLISFLMMLISIIPQIITGKGYFIYAGDYSYQQIPFFYHVADAVRNGNTGWDWLTNLGSDFVGSYSYYSLGSIFFWLIGWIRDGKIIIFLMPFVIAVKAGVAGVTSFSYIRRHVKNDSSAFLGALMYAFSGFQLVSLVFNTFADAIAFFPLLLLSFDKLVKENKKVFFLVMVAVMALTNYFMFFGQVVFIIVYYIFMCIEKEFRFSFRNFITIAFESVIGVMIAAVLLVPSFFTSFSVGRASNFINGVDMLSYSDNTILPKIIQSIFLLPDLPGTPMLFHTSDYNNWSTISLYIPFFSFVGVWSYVKRNKKDWLTRLLCICFIGAVIPVFNSMFYMFNAEYYARWFYMPVLFMCIATTKAIDDKYDLISGIKLQSIALAVISLIFFLPNTVYKGMSFENKLGKDHDPNNYEKIIRCGSMSEIPIVFWQTIAFAGVSLLLVYYFNRCREKEGIVKKITALMAVFTVLTSAVYINNSRNQMFVENLDFRETALDYTPELDGEEFFRINDINKSVRNNNFIWGYPTISSFHSIDIASDEAFYNRITTEKRYFRNVYTEKDYPVYGLFSVKYIFNHSTGDDLNVENYPADIKGFELYDKQGYFYIYENKHFVPMGFSYEYYITDERIQKYLDSIDMKDEVDRRHYLQLLLMRALILSDEDAKKYSDVIKPLPDDMLIDLSDQTYLNDCDQRAESSCSSFEYDTNGFRAEIDAEKNGLIFFSVPVCKGWTAYVNGKQTDIVTSQFGFSSVKINKGNNIIEFKYESYGLKTAMYISLSGLFILIIYSSVYFIMGRRKKK